MISETIVRPDNKAAATLPFTITQLDADEIETARMASEEIAADREQHATDAEAPFESGTPASGIAEALIEDSDEFRSIAAFPPQLAGIGIPDEVSIREVSTGAYSDFVRRSGMEVMVDPALPAYVRQRASFTYAEPVSTEFQQMTIERTDSVARVSPATNVLPAAHLQANSEQDTPVAGSSDADDSLEQMLAQIRGAQAPISSASKPDLARPAVYEDDDPMLNLIQTRLAGQAGSQPASADLAAKPGIKEPAYNRQLLGIYFDQNEHPAMIVLHDGDEYLLPLVSVLSGAGASLDTDKSDLNAAEIAINTPGGPARLLQSDLQLVDGQVLVSESALEEKLKIDVRFDQSAYALYLTLPWSLEEPSAYVAFTMPDPDFEPPSASIRNLRADVNFFANGSQQGLYGDFFVSGNLAGGGWRMRAEQLANGNTVPTDYFWSKDFGNYQALLGNSDFSLHPLLPTVEQTGAQFLYSTEPLPVANDVDLSRADTSRRINNGVRDISGMAQPGAVAELRIDGRVAERTRVRLDGSYDFPDVELPSRGYAEVLVMILDNRSGALIDTHDYSRRSGIELLSDGQHTIQAALGQQGNLLNTQRTSLGISTAAQWRYGLNEDITLEVGSQQVGGELGSEASLSMAFSNHWFGSLGVAQNENRTALGIDLEGGDRKWRVDVSAREFQVKGLAEMKDGDPSRAIPRQWSRSVRFQYQLNDNLKLGLVGRDLFNSYEQASFILPTVSWTNRKNFSVSARPNSAGRYRIDSRFTPNLRNSLRYSYEDDEHILDFRHRSARGMEYYASFSSGENSNGRFEMGTVNEFANSRFGTLQFALVNTDNDLGYSMEWEAAFLPGVNSRLRVSKGGNNFELDEGSNDFFLQWQLTFDFAVAQRRIVAVDSNYGGNTDAALTGPLLLGDRKIGSEYGVDRIELLIDGDNYTARVKGGRYYIEGLQPGMHKVSIDARHLPMELTPKADQSFWVRLEKSAATEMPLMLEVRYSFAGRVRDSEGKNVANQRLVVLDSNGEKVAELYTDQFGLYRSDNLPPGYYRVAAMTGSEELTSIKVEISDAYLFEQDLQLPKGNETIALSL